MADYISFVRCSLEKIKKIRFIKSYDLVKTEKDQDDDSDQDDIVHPDYNKVLAEPLPLYSLGWITVDSDFSDKALGRESTPFEIIKKTIYISKDYGIYFSKKTRQPSMLENKNQHPRKIFDLLIKNHEKVSGKYISDSLDGLDKSYISNTITNINDQFINNLHQEHLLIDSLGRTGYLLNRIFYVFEDDDKK